MYCNINILQYNIFLFNLKPFKKDMKCTKISFFTYVYEFTELTRGHIPFFSHSCMVCFVVDGKTDFIGNFVQNRSFTQSNESILSCQMYRIKQYKQTRYDIIATKCYKVNDDHMYISISCTIVFHILIISSRDSLIFLTWYTYIMYNLWHSFFNFLIIIWKIR